MSKRQMSGSFNWNRRNLELPAAPAGIRSSPNKEDIFPLPPTHHNTMDFNKGDI